MQKVNGSKVGKEITYRTAFSRTCAVAVGCSALAGYYVRGLSRSLVSKGRRIAVQAAAFNPTFGGCCRSSLW